MHEETTRRPAVHASTRTRAAAQGSAQAPATSHLTDRNRRQFIRARRRRVITIVVLVIVGIAAITLAAIALLHSR